MPINDLTKLVGNSRRREDLLKEFSLPRLSIDNLTTTPATGSMEADTAAASIGKQVAQMSAQLGDMLASQNRQFNQLLAGSTTLQSSASRNTGTSTGSQGGMLSD